MKEQFEQIIYERERRRVERERWSSLSLAEKAKEIREGLGLTHGGGKKHRKKRKPRKDKRGRNKK